MCSSWDTGLHFKYTSEVLGSFEKRKGIRCLRILLLRYTSVVQCRENAINWKLSKWSTWERLVAWLGKTPLPFGHSSSAWVRNIFPICWARKDFFLSHVHTWQYFLRGWLSLLYLQSEAEVIYSPESLGIKSMMDVLFVLIVPGLCFRHAPHSLPCWWPWLESLTPRSNTSAANWSPAFTPLPFFLHLTNTCLFYLSLYWVYFS